MLKPRLHPPVTAVTPYLFSGAFADGEVTQSRKFALSAPALTIRDYQAGSFRRPLHAFAMLALFLYEMDVWTFFVFSASNGPAFRCRISHFALGMNIT